MASLRRKSRGTWLARWRDADGNLVELATGEYSREKAIEKANKMEAEAKFWEDVPSFHAYAAMNYSPRYCHESFIAAKHIRFDKFCMLLREAGVEFVKSSQWRDTKKKTSTRGKKYRYNGRLLTAPQIAEQSGAGLNVATLRYRLEHGWSMDEALSTPPMSPSESGKKGAAVANK